MPRNAYFYYMVDFKAEQETILGRSLTMAEASEMAAASWNGMDDERRDLYRSRAKGGKSVIPRNNYEKRTTQGVPFSHIDRVQNAKVNEEKQMIDRIHNLLRNFTVPIGIGSYPIFMMSGNYFYRRQDKFVPAELALVKFTFRNGIEERYHAYLNPGSVELGYAADAKTHSDDTHKMPIPPYAMGESNFQEVFRKLWKRLVTDQRNHQFDDGKPFVFTYTGDGATEEDNILMLKSFMTQLSNKESPIDIYPLSRLFFILTTNLFEIDRFQKIDNISIVHILLSRDQYEHHSGFSCEHHEKVDACAHCALSKATRWAYLMAKHLCDSLGFNLVSGKHFPMSPEMQSMHRSMQSLYDSDAEDSNCESETQSEHSFDDRVSIGKSSCLSDETRQLRLNKLLDRHGNDASSKPKNVMPNASTCDYETDSVDDELLSRSAGRDADTSSCSSKINRRRLLNKLFFNHETSTINDDLSSIESASVFDDDATVKSSQIAANSRRRMMLKLMNKGDDLSSICSQLSLDE